MHCASTLRAPHLGDTHITGESAKLRSHQVATVNRPVTPTSIMTILARFSVGRILLHLLAMHGDRCVRFHLEGIVRELPSIALGLAMLSRMHSRLLAAVTLYLARPIKHSTANRDSFPQSLAAVLHRRDVLLTQGNSQFAAVIKCLTRSPWTHVSVYVGPLDDGPDLRSCRTDGTISMKEI